MSRLLAASPSMRRRQPLTPMPSRGHPITTPQSSRVLDFATPLSSRVQPSTTPLREPDPIVRRVGDGMPLSLSTSSFTDRQAGSEEKFQEIVNGYENQIHGLMVLLIDVRKHSKDLNQELQRKLDEAIRRYEEDQSKKARSFCQKKMGEEKKKSRCQSDSFNKGDFARSTPKETAHFVFARKPEKKKSALLQRSSSICTPRFNSASFSNAPVSSELSSSSVVASSSLGTSSCENLDNIGSRQHSFEKHLHPDEIKCHACSLEIGPRCLSYNCKVCQTVCHPNCLNAVASCVPFFEPPRTLDDECLTLQEYCSDAFHPKLPHLVVRCVEYLNKKTSYKGLYVDLSQDDRAESLMELILHDPNASNIEKFGPKVAAHCILKFLDSLRIPLIPEQVAKKFLKAAELGESSRLKEIIADLPVVHKNVLAYLILHWKLLIKESPSSGLTEEALGGAILPSVMRIQTFAAFYFWLFHGLLSLPSSFWSSLVDMDESSGLLYARNRVPMRQQQPVQEIYGRLWG